MPKENKSSLLVAIVKVTGTVVVAALGLTGTLLSTYLSQRTTSNSDALRSTVNQLDRKIIPGIESELNKQRDDNETLVQTVSDVRERLARIEGLLESHRAFRREILSRPPPVDREPLKEEHEVKKPKKTFEDLIQSSQKRAMLPSLDIAQMPKAE